MLKRRVCRGPLIHLRAYSTPAIRPVPALPSVNIDAFRKHAFEPALPAMLPKAFKHIPAISHWFLRPKSTILATRLNMAYFREFASLTVPLEITNNGQFIRIEGSIGFFLEFVETSTSRWILPPPEKTTAREIHVGRIRTQSSDSSPSSQSVPTAKIYIAQAPLGDLPNRLQADVPTPELVRMAGKGDVYDSSIWLGQAPTYTPLHRDPNPNLFVQLGGKKVVKLYEPRTGNAVFSKVQEMIGGSASATMRGEEMMQGKEKEALEEEVWGDGEHKISGAWQAELEPGDALFIPKSWWHSVKGLGEGMNGSVNWWFR